ncbi:MAG: membrane protein insertase YidC [Lachnospiraceae bacterium]|jgi:YidC/Oxa1 family membrane protein insertase|nr:membrane protein insertase YidC [uncultured Acetatifactor sp.]MCI9218158.1 membrane protein insertase YidC [Lachnospiraceae bacterium]
MNIIYTTFNWILGLCHNLCKNYGLAIILFTFFTKIILLPVSIWVQKNSIKMVKMQPAINQVKITYFGDKDTIAEEEHKIYKKYGYNPFATIIPSILQILILIGVITVIRGNINDGSYDLYFCGIDLALVPSVSKGLLILSPLMAGASAFLLCVVQNAANVLQSEQSRGMKWGTMAFSVGLSLYLGWFVPVGVAVYWICSNLFSILQLYILNLLINPRKYIDYEELERTKKELNEMGGVENRKKSFWSDEAKRENADYKRFFSIGNKHLVFYSESSGFYKYFRGVIEYLLDNTNIVIHYITSDPKDAIFGMAEVQPQIKPYYIGEKKLITLMMKMDADIVVMTMPDLENYHIKRSYVRKDIQYIFIPHSMCSLNLTMRTASIDHFDTIFCTGKHQREETEKTEIAYHLPKKTLVDWGYCLLDQMRADYVENAVGDRKTILIAPSWQKDNIVDTCLDELLEALEGKGYKIIVRPHPQHVRQQPQRMEQLKAKFSSENIEIQTDFSSNDTVFQADMMITDWSGIAYEYSFTTYKPVLFIDTPLKIMNSEYQRIDTEPFNIWMREILGKVIKPSEAGGVYGVITEMLGEADKYHDIIKSYANEYVYNLDHSGEVGAKYIISELKRIIENKKVGKGR